MSKISTGTMVNDANTFISSADATSITLLNSGSITLGGVTSVVGSSGSDSISLNLPTTFNPLGFTLDTFAAFDLDTKNASIYTQDSLVGTTSSDTVNFHNTGIAAMVNARYTSSGGTDILNLTSAADKLTLVKAFTGTINSNGGADSITGSSSVDTILLGEASSIADWRYLSGGKAVDVITGTSHDDKITLSSTSKIDYTSGGGADSLIGSSGADTITVYGATAVSVTGAGGVDNITLSTSSAADTVQFNAASNSSVLSSDSITNFQSGTSSTSIDTLNFTNLQVGTFSYLGSGVAFNGLHNSEAVALQSGSNTIVQIDVNGDFITDMSITLVGVTSSTIDAGDFAWS
jgi:hypothetical protein